MPVLIDFDLCSIIPSCNQFERKESRVQLSKSLSKDTLGIVDRVFRESCLLVESCLPDDYFLVRLVSYNRWRSILSFIVLKDLDPAVSPEPNTRVLSSQINADPRLS